jgi:hypothetical protein
VRMSPELPLGLVPVTWSLAMARPPHGHIGPVRAEVAVGPVEVVRGGRVGAATYSSTAPIVQLEPVK